MTCCWGGIPQAPWAVTPLQVGLAWLSMRGFPNTLASLRRGEVPGTTLLSPRVPAHLAGKEETLHGSG